ncbi:hypothetical protein [Bacillus cereus]|uniref:hypothetical protein n=1 Tax=Bacillus cereus TaxID=1396 RepID=UPI000BF41A6F|nr:hypothetical protein [Bacillus cereus]PET96224.1 hypothetical protein CN534_23820 [Bacillus cereus]PEZ54707.1 hypothetical protein CN370_27510 [Bacillus cereus]PFB62380.1 hypothetical protein CN292_26995 [Bacillus cereus]HDR8152412.1 hypothetical protein [Bacillus cereus]
MKHKSLFMIAMKNIRDHKCANCLQHNLDIKKFTPISEWEADVIYACPTPECNHIEFKENVIDDGYFLD